MSSNARAELAERLTKIRLLPKELDEKRMEVKVVVLPTEGYPKGYLPHAKDEDGSSARFEEAKYDKQELVCHTGACGQISVFRKAFPHCLYGVMLVDNVNVDQVSITDYSPQDREAFFSTAREFAKLVESKQCYPNISWTYDPYTRDRKSGQSQLWYHMHLNSYTEDDRTKITSTAVPLGIANYGETKRAFVDEYSIIASHAFSDYLKQHLPSATHVLPFECDGLPNIGFRIKGGWDNLVTEEFDQLIVQLHEAYHTMYAELKHALFEGESGPWTRPQLRQDAIDRLGAIRWLTEKNQLLIRGFILALRPSILKQKRSFFVSNPKDKITSHIVPLAGPSYAVSIAKASDGSLLLSFRPQLFSDTGAAGLQHAFGTTVKLKRGAQVYTPDRLAQKEEFEKELALVLGKSSS